MVEALIAAVGVVLVAVVSAIGAAKLQGDRLRSELRTEFMAEEALNHLLRDKRWRRRSFLEIKRRVGGFDDDALRRLLVRAGALRFEDDDGVEYWGLRELNKDILGPRD